MKYGYCPLASGSKGNCIFFGTPATKILIDAGISAKSTEQKLAKIDVDLAEIKAILITHEHTDHILGLKTLAFRHQIPVIANVETAKRICEALRLCPKFKIFTTNETFRFEDIEIRPFTVQHDAADPVAFTLRTESVKIGICTDLGFVTPIVKNELQGCDYLYIEANHEPSMVFASSRPMIYKERVLGRSGHLSNESCAHLLADCMHEKLKHIHLAHLSQECNTPESARQRVEEKIGRRVPISIAPQNDIGTPVLFDAIESISHEFSPV